MSAPAKILVCDHRGAGLERDLAGVAPTEFTFESTDSLRRTLERLANGRPDVLVLDPLARQGSVELAALEAARSEDQREALPLEEEETGAPAARRLPRPPIPLLLVVDEADDEAALRADRALVAGVWDLVGRNARPEEFTLRLRRLVAETQRAKEMAELRHLASHDDRTDLLRPKTFQARFHEHFSAAQRHEHELAFVLIDLDRFGSINKRYDHTVGDELIERVGAVIRRTLRVEDVAGRLGGDEFAVLLPYTGKLDAARVVNRLRQEIAKLTGKPERVDEVVEVSASIGFETFDGKDLDSLETLRRHAERALRSAKTSGGDRAVYYRNLENEGA